MQFEVIYQTYGCNCNSVHCTNCNVTVIDFLRVSKRFTSCKEGPSSHRERRTESISQWDRDVRKSQEGTV